MTVSYADKTSYSRDGLDAYRWDQFCFTREPERAFSPHSQHREMQTIQEGTHHVLIM